MKNKKKDIIEKEERKQIIKKIEKMRRTKSETLTMIEKIERISFLFSSLTNKLSTIEKSLNNSVDLLKQEMETEEIKQEIREGGSKNEITPKNIFMKIVGEIVMGIIRSLLPF